MEYSSKWNTHQNGTLIKMEHSYYQKRNSYSSWNENPHIKSIVGNLRQSRNPPSVAVACLLVDLGGRPILPYLPLVFPFWVLDPPVLVSSPHPQAMDYREEPWILIQ